jgi:hypothetical protein
MTAHKHTPEVHEHVDAWHHHEPVEGMPQEEHLSTLNIRSLMTWGWGITVFLIIVIVAIRMYFYDYVTRLRAIREERLAWLSLSEPSRKAKSDAMQKLSLGTGDEHYAWAPQGNQQVQIPISKAMEKVIRQYESR